MKILEYLAASLATTLLLFLVKDKIDSFFMYKARDIFRLKARKSRLLSTPTLPLIFGFDAPTTVELETKTAMTTYELAEMDGRTEDKPIYIALNKQVFDVSSNRRKFGPGKKLHALAGHDASKAFATGCFKPKCVIGSVSGLSNGQLRELARWKEYFAHNGKYPHVATLVDSEETPQTTSESIEVGLDSSETEVIVHPTDDFAPITDSDDSRESSAVPVFAAEEPITQVTKVETVSTVEESLERAEKAVTVNREATDDKVVKAELFSKDEESLEQVAMPEPTKYEDFESGNSLPGLKSEATQRVEPNSLAVGSTAQVHPFDADDI